MLEKGTEMDYKLLKSPKTNPLAVKSAVESGKSAI
jgi:hypothetical protein